MTTLLIKIFIKNSNEINNTKVRKMYGMLSGIVGIFINLMLAILKFFAGNISGSIAITGDALNNLTDCITSIVTIIGFRWASLPADKEHPFGHSRAEYIAGILVSIIIFLTGYEILRNSIHSILHHNSIHIDYFVVYILTISFVCKFWMFLFNRKLGKKINSDALIAVSADSINDVFITIATIIPFIIYNFLSFNIDGYLGVLISFIFFRAGYVSFKNSLKIIGEPICSKMAQEIKEIVKNDKNVLGTHDLLVHSYGPSKYMASIHVEVSENLTLKEAHDIGENAANQVFLKTGIQLLTHIDPINTKDENLKKFTLITLDHLNNNYKNFLAHEFRIINKTKNPIFVFDLEIPYEYKKNQQKLKNTLYKEISEKLDGYDININIEFGYISN
ncbi:MAG: cation diffusion facilitator family transporter [Defluviitaleaceae bacterium]|nr:cation diffusion facilitator family transporter [Defluviitaleaceae bacterium]